MNLRFKKTIASILVMVMVCLSISSVFSVAHEIEEAGFSTPHKISFGFSRVETPDHCPACPTNDHPSTDHEHYSCDHHTNVSLTVQIVYRLPVSVELPPVNSDGFQFIPKVYLDKFIPPQNFA